MTAHVLKWLNSEFPARENWIPGLLDRYSTEEAAIAAMQEFAASLPSDIHRTTG